MEISKVDVSNLLKELTDIGVALSAENDHSRLLEMILFKAMEITNADGGSLYTHTDDQRLKFDHAIKGLENPIGLLEVRRDIARLKTEIRRREVGQFTEEQVAGRDKLRARRRK